MTKLPFLDLGAIQQSYAPALREAFERVLRSGWYILGQEVEQFEREYAAFCGARECVGVANGLDALTLALRALGIGAGDEVIVPSNTYIATWLAVSQVGATPVPVEPIEATANLDPARIAAALTPRTRALMPVHLYGQPADLAPILALAREHGLKVVEDAAQAHGARYQGRRLGAHGDAVAVQAEPVAQDLVGVLTGVSGRALDLGGGAAEPRRGRGLHDAGDAIRYDRVQALFVDDVVAWIKASRARVKSRSSRAMNLRLASSLPLFHNIWNCVASSSKK